ncbi:hypothetical protein EAF00_008033 [Botryotinia globosa]|nr:hypothetical protein EAF00_008033 [Botryotinia globosa]
MHHGRQEARWRIQFCEPNLLDTSNWSSIAWLASLYAVLASGLRFSEQNSSWIQEKSQLYRQSHELTQPLQLTQWTICSSILIPVSQDGKFSCTTFIACIQTMLILGHVLQNDTKPESALIRLGTTARIAQSLGIHTQKRDASSSSRKLWLGVIWQDSLLSLCFDRIPVTRPITAAEDL